MITLLRSVSIRCRTGQLRGVLGVMKAPACIKSNCEVDDHFARSKVWLATFLMGQRHQYGRPPMKDIYTLKVAYIKLNLSIRADFAKLTKTIRDA